MTSSWEQFEELIKAEMRKRFSETAIEHGMNPRNMGDIENADGFGMVTGSCGDTMKMWIKVKDGKISDASFLSDGCGTTMASGSMVTELTKGKSIAEAYKIDQKKVLDALDGLPEESEHCALLAANTLKETLNNYLAMKKEPWKKNYPQR
jgi:nitrogen fixation NifU-like protein